MKVGDRVRWTSKAGGHAKVKEGVVKYIVLPRVWIKDALTDSALSRIYGFPSEYSCRNHESYVIDVSGRLYWPRVKGLEVVNAAESR